jgi:hypothetical protein
MRRVAYGLLARDLGISPNEVEEMYLDRLYDVLESWREVPPFAAVTAWDPPADARRSDLSPDDIADLRELE